MAEPLGLPQFRRSEHLDERNAGKTVWDRAYGVRCAWLFATLPLQSRSERSFLDSVILDSLL
jgi:hypothetical protein